MMSNESCGSGSSVSASKPCRSHSVPSLCWCGQPIVELLSKTTKNPDRPFFRCEHAAKMKLKDDKHYFKWVDEVEVSIELKVKMLEDEVSEIKDAVKKFFELQNQSRSNFETEIEEKILMKLEIAIEDVRAGLKKTLCYGFVLGCVVSIGCIKLFG